MTRVVAILVRGEFQAPEGPVPTTDAGWYFNDITESRTCKR